MSIAVPRGYRTDRTDVLVLADQIRAAAHARRLELEAAEIAGLICDRIDKGARHDADDAAPGAGPMSPFRAACMDWLAEVPGSGFSSSGGPHGFRVRIIDDGAGLALFGLWAGDSYHEAMLSVPGVRDARFNNATDFWPEKGKCDRGGIGTWTPSWPDVLDRGPPPLAGAPRTPQAWRHEHS